MPFILLKTNAGMNFKAKSGKTISLRGFCLLNEVSKNELDELKELEPFKRMIKEGYVEVSNSATTENANALATETIKEQAKVQSKKTQNIKKEG